MKSQVFFRKKRLQYNFLRENCFSKGFILFAQNYLIMPFNLSQHSLSSDIVLIQAELSHFGIKPQQGEMFSLSLGDASLCTCPIDIPNHLNQGIKELKNILWGNWKRMFSLCHFITSEKGSNCCSFDNTIFLFSVKKAYFLSCQFDELYPISQAIFELMNKDIRDISNEMIQEFNSLYLQIKAMHRLTVRELYRLRLISRYLKLTKTSENTLSLKKYALSVSGPWASLGSDLPMAERLWSGQEDEEYFEQRSRAIRRQMRSNPEFLEDGYYYKFQDDNRGPYSWENRADDSPYPSNPYYQIS